MMIARNAYAVWRGNLSEGIGEIKTESGDLESEYSYVPRLGEEKIPNPEELLGASIVSCFTMTLVAGLSRNGYRSELVSSKARVRFERTEQGYIVAGIDLITTAEVPEISEGDFERIASAAKAGSPISKALSATPITVTAKLIQ